MKYMNIDVLREGVKKRDKLRGHSVNGKHYDTSRQLICWIIWQMASFQRIERHLMQTCRMQRLLFDQYAPNFALPYLHVIKYSAFVSFPFKQPVWAVQQVLLVHVGQSGS